MDRLTLLTERGEPRINGREALYFVVQGIKLGSAVTRAAGAEHETTDDAFALGATRFELKGNDQELHRRVANFFTATQVEGKASGYDGDSFVSYAKDWSPKMNSARIRNTGLESYGTQNGRVVAGDAIGIVKQSFASIRGRLKQSVLGIDGTANVLLVPGKDLPPVVMRTQDALNCYGGNHLCLLRDPS